jgi:predicted HD superfamily hydrolase involved in NAD metabolism
MRDPDLDTNELKKRVASINRAGRYLTLIQERLPEKTARHAMSVAELMLFVAEQAEIEPEQAMAAGLLHDLHKTAHPKALLDAAARFDILVNETQRAKPNLLHGPVAAEVCRQKYEIDDEVYDAIYWHTTGRCEFGKVGLALYFADFSEQFRTHPEATEARTVFERDGFHKALAYVSEKKLAHISTKPNIDPITHEFHAWLQTHLSDAD